MRTAVLEIPKTKALELYRAYKTHQAYQTPEDYEVQRTYQLISQGRLVIQAIESIKQAGLNFEGLPRLALMRADQKECFVRIFSSGGAEFRNHQWSNQKRNTITLPPSSFPTQTDMKQGKTLLPTVPVHLRPKRGIANYHVLWEAEWKKIPPGDPYLLRQIGRGDMWLVVAAWELTEVEKAAMRTRINAS